MTYREIYKAALSLIGEGGREEDVMLEEKAEKLRKYGKIIVCPVEPLEMSSSEIRKKIDDIEKKIEALKEIRITDIIFISPGNIICVSSVIRFIKNLITLAGVTSKRLLRLISFIPNSSRYFKVCEST